MMWQPWREVCSLRRHELYTRSRLNGSLGCRPASGVKAQRGRARACDDTCATTSVFCAATRPAHEPLPSPLAGWSPSVVAAQCAGARVRLVGAGCGLCRCRASAQDRAGKLHGSLSDLSRGGSPGVQRRTDLCLHRRAGAAVLQATLRRAVLLPQGLRVSAYAAESHLGRLRLSWTGARARRVGPRRAERATSGAPARAKCCVGRLPWPGFTRQPCVDRRAVIPQPGGLMR